LPLPHCKTGWCWFLATPKILNIFKDWKSLTLTGYKTKSRIAPAFVLILLF